jgi:hypothetical protein
LPFVDALDAELKSADTLHAAWSMAAAVAVQRLVPLEGIGAEDRTPYSGCDLPR